MARRILAVFAGILVAFLCFMLFQATSGAMYPPPPGLDLDNHADLEAYISTLPQTAFAIVLIGYAVGSLMGGYVTARVATLRHAQTPTLVLGVVLTIAAILNLRSIPHPTWFAVINLATFIPLALAGSRLARLQPPAR